LPSTGSMALVKLSGSNLGERGLKPPGSDRSKPSGKLQSGLLL
jgi:hypothetical protein